MHLRGSSGDIYVAIHETVHLYHSNIGVWQMKEGMTDYFARKIAANASIVPKEGYTDERGAIEQWSERTNAHHPDVWEGQGIYMLHAHLDLESARSGSFEAAAGSLADFLTEIGAAPRRLDFH
jgi:hypothetical protein